MRSALYLILTLISIQALHGQSVNQGPDYGLAFASHEVSKDHRTGLDLNAGKTYSFNTDFSIEFDMALQRLTNGYGYVLRIIANDSINLDLMSIPEHEEFHDLALVINTKRTDLEFDYTDIGLRANQWTSVRISFSYSKKEITLSWNDKSKTQPFNPERLRNFRFFFGANDFGKFTTTDAPPVILKNISIIEGERLRRKWLLKQHANTRAYDSVQNESADVINPIWLIDRHTHWTFRKSFSIGQFPSVAFNGDSAILYATDRKNLYVYHLETEMIETRKLTSGTPTHSDANQPIYVPKTQQLINYDLFSNSLQAFDFSKNAWPNQDTTYELPNFWHHNKFYNSHDNTLYTFGGYGHFIYKNALHRYDAATSKWVETKASGFIPPRYLAASGLWPSRQKILIFGGYGSQSGKQELSPQSFYDLYSLDLTNLSIEKIREFSPAHDSEDVTFSNSLVVNERENCFYVLGFPRNKYQSTVKLWRYSLTDETSSEYADSIAFPFHDEDSFCDLFYSPAANEMIAITVHKENKTYQVQVHSIQYPPLHERDVLQSGPPVQSTATLTFIATTLIVSGVCIGFIYFRKRRRPNPAAAAKSTNINPFVLNQEEQKPVSTILLFGGFQVFNKAGVDISAKFSMTLKELFILILVHSVKYENGVSTKIIQEYLWPDKDEVSARNNRNVNVKKLRALLDEVGTITLDNNNSYLQLTMDDQVHCDYRVVFRYLNHPHSSEETEKISAIIRTLRRGSLLPNVQSDWLDSFKSEISNQVIDTLLEYSQKLDFNRDDKLLIEIADTIFAYDTINQEALVIKCSVLNKKGKYSLAKTWYDHFAKEYKNLYAENYPRSFEEVIS